MVHKTFASIKERIGRIKLGVINDTLDEVVDIVRSKTPEDTGLTDSSRETEQPKLFGDIAIGSVINRTPYVRYIEHGVPGRIYQYNKPKGMIFYKGQGAGMVKRSIDQVEQLLHAKYKQRLSSVIRSLNNSGRT